MDTSLLADIPMAAEDDQGETEWEVALLSEDEDQCEVITIDSDESQNSTGPKALLVPEPQVLAEWDADCSDDEVGDDGNEIKYLEIKPRQEEELGAEPCVLKNKETNRKRSRYMIGDASGKASNGMKILYEMTGDDHQGGRGGKSSKLDAPKSTENLELVDIHPDEEEEVKNTLASTAFSTEGDSKLVGVPLTSSELFEFGQIKSEPPEDSVSETSNSLEPATPVGLIINKVFHLGNPSNFDLVTDGTVSRQALTFPTNETQLPDPTHEQETVAIKVEPPDDLALEQTADELPASEDVKLEDLEEDSDSETSLNVTGDILMIVRRANTDYFTCKLCCMQFTEGEHAANHLKVHAPSRPHQCPICKQQFALETVLAGHMSRHPHFHPLVEIIECQDCKKEFNTEKVFLEHQKVCPFRAEKFPCTVCGKEFPDKVSQRNHLATHIGKKLFRCNLCDYRCTNRISLQRHQESHSKGEQQLECPVCKKKFPSSCNLQALHRHIMSHKKLYSCNVCQFKCKQHDQLVAHLACHADMRLFACTLCEDQTVFKTGKALRKHMVVDHNTSPKVVRRGFLCSICGKVYSSSCSLKQHLVVHTGEKPHQCNLCGKRFTQRSTLRSHLFTHNGIKPYKCPDCPYECTYNGHLIRHMRIHTGDRPYCCKVCGKTFNQSGSLKNHLLTHTRDKKNKKPIIEQP